MRPGHYMAEHKNEQQHTAINSMYQSCNLPACASANEPDYVTGPGRPPNGPGEWVWESSGIAVIHHCTAAVGHLGLRTQEV